MKMFAVETELYLPRGHEVETCEMESQRAPRDASLDETGAGSAAAEIIRHLDKHYTREQVHCIARWMSYLSTQA